MSAGAEVSVTPAPGGGYRVRVQDRGVTTEHSVDVPPGLADELGWTGVDQADLVKESFAFLLEREPATSILPAFGLEVIGRYFPDYPTEIRRRAPGAG